MHCMQSSDYSTITIMIQYSLNQTLLSRVNKINSHFSNSGYTVVALYYKIFILQKLHMWLYIMIDLLIISLCVHAYIN